MDIVLIVLGCILLFVGFAGSVLPAIPGPPVAFIGLLLLKFHSTASAELSWHVVFWLGAFTTIITIIDIYMPVWGTKKFGGSNWGKWGSTIGLIFGLFAPVLGPLTFLLGPFAGAVIGELLGGNTMDKALKSGWGSFLGFLAGTFAKLLVCTVLLIYFIKTLW